MSQIPLRNNFESTSAYRMEVCALASAALMILIVIAWGAVPGIDSDSAWQFKAVEQRINGTSTAFTTLVTANPADLSANKSDWITSWAPGNALIVYSLMRLHLSMGLAVRIIAIMCLVSGSAGWSLWVNSFSIPKSAKVLLSICIPWTLYAHNALFYYGAETLLFGTVPWVLLLVVKSLRYVVGLRSSQGFRGRSLRCALLCVIACMTPIIGVNFINQLHANNMNLITASHAFSLRAETLLFAVANPALAAMSAGAPLRYVTDLTGRASQVWFGVAGLPGGVMVLILLSRRKPSHAHAVLACCVFLASLICITAVRGNFSNVTATHSNHTS